MLQKSKLKNTLLKLLNISPYYLQDFIGKLYLRFIFPMSSGPIRYIKFCKFLNESQWWPRYKLEQYQNEKLKQLLRHAYKNVGYYRELLKKLNLTTEDFKSIKDLKKLPILTKEDVVKNFEKLTSRGISKKYFKLVCTSGSTGKPMQFYCDKRANPMEHAYDQRHVNWMGVSIDERRVKLWSRPFIEKEIKDIYLYEPHLRRLSLSTTPYATDSLDKYIEFIKQFNPNLISGNPSFLYLLACYAQKRNINSVNFKSFLSIFENLFPYQRELIKKQFHCEIFNIYACEERVICAMECSRHEGMHIDMEKGILEIIEEDGEILPPGKTGKIIATGLHNYVMPLIRYDTGDIGSISENPCSCGRGLQLLKSLEGRSNNILRFKNKFIYSTTLSVILWEFKNIKECQFVQENEDELRVNIVKREGYSDKDTYNLIKVLKQMINERLNININFVDYIPRTKMGKFTFVISRIKSCMSQ